MEAHFLYLHFETFSIIWIFTFLHFVLPKNLGQYEIPIPKMWKSVGHLGTCSCLNPKTLLWSQHVLCLNFTHMPKVKIMTSTSFNLDQCMHVVKQREDTRQHHNELEITKNIPILQSNIVLYVFMIRGNIGPSSLKTI